MPGLIRGFGISRDKWLRSTPIQRRIDGLCLSCKSADELWNAERGGWNSEGISRPYCHLKRALPQAICGVQQRAI
jgi:hypothetical protein